ncbi:MAG TPA: hypothetical protein VNW04_06075 [Puia sp.]|jgi:hypothetical protein|nr:hypothetical protein [Puia sp.]
MKESNFYSDDFEQLIREKTEQYKMYPSERVWKGVHNSLHTKRRWFIGSMSLLVTGILFFAGRELITPSSRSIVLRKPATTAGSVTEAQKPWLAAHIPHHPTLASLHSPAVSSPARHNTAADNAADDEQDPGYKGISITLSHPVMDPSDLSGWVSRVQLPDHAPDLPVIAARNIAVDAAKTPEDGVKLTNRTGAETTSGRETAEETDADGISARSVLASLSGRGAEATRNAKMTGRLARNGGDGKGIAADGPESSSEAAKASAAAIAEAQDQQRINWLHEYAMNTLPPPNKRGRTFFQLTLAPTVNYRSLNGLDPAYEKYGPLPGFSVSPGQLMNHSTAFGFEFGGSILYRLTRNLSVKGGLQFNFARYKITAFADSTGGGGSQGQNLNSYLGYVVDSLQRNVSNGQRASATSGGSPVTRETLNNDYYQLSAPIGFELRVLGNERLQFNLGATIQPSYLLGTTSYTLTQGMTKYSKEPDMYRKWNVSGGVEAFLSYRTGNIRWQIGPEFRYQLLSTYTSKYPATENLKTYGLKIGLTKMLP